jgi:hypothetical protein
MINPSANGWIDKYFVEQKTMFDEAFVDDLSLYKSIRETGFIYGHIISIHSNPIIDISQWKSDEISKIALLTTLYDVYQFCKKETNSEDFIKKTVAFYKEMTPSNFDFIRKIISSSASSKLETLINERVQTNKDIISKNFSHIQYFNYSNPVKHFYDQTTTGVKVLIKRNQKRLTKEISESKELMQLLAKSTQKDLSTEEKKKVKKQLLDICKSIPSLTIFLLPGGGLLLPILIKFIPQLLPSAFNENLED